MKKAIYKLVKLETTSNWDEDFLRALGITKIHTWYIFDSLRCTNCCEIISSYELLPVYEAADNEWDLSDSQIDEFNDNSSLNPSDDTIYVHCSQIDPIAQELPSEFEREYEYDEKAEIDESWSDMLEASAIFNQGYLHLL